MELLLIFLAAYVLGRVSGLSASTRDQEDPAEDEEKPGCCGLTNPSPTPPKRD